MILASSHALRVRGLKHAELRRLSRIVRVARSTRAWIETSSLLSPMGRYVVARSTRAWIETFDFAFDFAFVHVARSTRAWIETCNLARPKARRSSHALRVRGLKQANRRCR